MLQRATVRPSTQFYLRFSLLMVRSPGFGSIHYYYFALFRLAFTTPPPDGLSLHTTVTRWIVLQKARRHRDETNLRFFSPKQTRWNTFCLVALFPITGQELYKKGRFTLSRLRLLVRTQIQVLFHSPLGVLFAFPSRYLFSIDHVIYLALEGGPPRFSQGFTCPDLLDNRIYSQRTINRASRVNSLQI